ncbi:para-nitrobenzyl esterase [Glonium stellatum]|uniref:Carboxylic ester hydrolase n=1 Tax=Glonium stellatum TaxID=574774 RepID=A0A8E2JTW7_9PEZI|nr:para-nitrobenzyl esterase [Glonium stellatum]
MRLFFTNGHWALALTVVVIFSRKVAAVSSLSISTSVGTVYGLINGTTPNVAQFLGVPYAEPPIGDLRWLPAIPKSKVGSIDATAFGPNCPQYDTSIPSVYEVDTRQFLIPSNSTSEDCLFANIWAPYNYNKENDKILLPVIVWIYGGGFQTGGGNIEYQIPSQWVERSQKHIVVGINYRLNIFGFPNAAGLNQSDLNLGLLDQRLALEWVRFNIANFGGDPARISLWGQSAGAMSVDYYNFAYPNDPIVSGLIMDSGTALLPSGTTDPFHSNFTFVAGQFGCGNLSAEAELACMRNVSQADIESFLRSYGDSGKSPALSFNPVVDNRTKFANFTSRALAKNFTQVPAIIGTNTDEGRSLVQWNPNGPNMTAANLVTLNAFLCPADKTTINRYAVGATTFRYLYAGNFSNISPRLWEGAYHSSELPLIFGTSGIVRGASTVFELALSMRMQDLYLAFAQDNIHGLPAERWSAYEPEGTAMLLGSGETVTQNVSVEVLEAPCDGSAAATGALPPS